MSLTSSEAKLLGEIHADVRTLVQRDADKEKRLRTVERKLWGHSLIVTMIAAAFAKFGLPLPFGGSS
jgi:hypothetical protein